MSENLRIESVSGGAGGTAAKYDDIAKLARIYDRAGDSLRGDAWDDKGLVADRDLLASAVLSPKTFAEAEAAIFSATVGPNGLASRALGIEADALIMQVCVEAYQLVDKTVDVAFEALDYLGGYVLGAVLPSLLVAGGVGAVALVLANPGLTAYLATHPEVRDALLKGGSDKLQQLMEDNPELLQHLINGGGGLVDGLLSNLPPEQRALLLLLGVDPIHATTNDAAAELAGLFVDGDPKVVENPPGELNGASLAVPHSVEDLMGALATTNSKGDGVIDIQQIGSGPDARYIVNLPGTDDWIGDPDDVRDLGSNLRLIGGDDTVYSRGIANAMAQAGIPAGADVMLVGHSQGGMTAAQLAADPGFQSQYDVKHVLTAGAPTAQVPHIPGATQVLSLENTGDIVPLSDGEDNPDAANRTTVRFDGRTGSVGGNHDMAVYTEGGAAVDGSDDVSIRTEIERLRADGFLPEEGSTVASMTKTYEITRNH